MHVASAAPPGAPATSFQNVGLSGRTAGRTTTLRMRPSSLLHHTRTTRTYVRIVSPLGSGPRVAGSHMAEQDDGHARTYPLNSTGPVDLLVTTRAIAGRGARVGDGGGLDRGLPAGGGPCTGPPHPAPTALGGAGVGGRGRRPPAVPGGLLDAGPRSFPQVVARDAVPRRGRDRRRGRLHAPVRAPASPPPGPHRVARGARSLPGAHLDRDRGRDAPRPEAGGVSVHVRGGVVVRVAGSHRDAPRLRGPRAPGDDAGRDAGGGEGRRRSVQAHPLPPPPRLPPL